MPLNWQVLVSAMTNVQKLVHLSARYDEVDEARITAGLLGMRRQAYNDELTIQAQNSGCHGLTGRAGATVIEALEAQSKRDAASIANTYNYFLALEIVRAGERQPGGNMEYYARAVAAWMPTYWAYKDSQIVTATDGSARAKAQQDFYIHNENVKGVAKLEPRSAVCPVCVGWIARGLVPLRVAMNNPPPYHVNCPHIFDTRPDTLPREACPLLWMGE